ncbi:hypothetical protein BDF14DRAFT_1999233 [Spinellus fusiger]|nr:hypothetical protein BDF14DRAFT_1999233 [Spinellus fusiger]
MSERENVLMRHLVSSIHKDLELLKEQQYITQTTYSEILVLLPNPHPTTTLPAPPAQTPRHSYGYPPSHSPRMDRLSLQEPTQQQPTPPPAYPAPVSGPTSTTSLGTAEALFDYHGTGPNDLYFRKDDIIQVHEHVDNNWWRGSVYGRTGHFPRNYVRPLGNISTLPKSNVHLPPMAPQIMPSHGHNYGPPALLVESNYNSGYGQTTHYPPPSAHQPPAPAAYPPPPSHQPPTIYPTPVTVPQPQVSHPPAPAPAPGGGGESKVSGYAKKFGENVANAATWGFGATVGSEVAHSIF